MSEQPRNAPSDFEAMVRRELNATSAKLSDLDEQIAELQVEREALADREHHLQALLGKGRDEGAAPANIAPSEALEHADLVVSILAEAGSPLHFRAIYEEFAARGGIIGGKDPANNLLTKYYNDPRVRRTARGTYELADGPPIPETDRSRTPSPN